MKKFLLAIIIITSPSLLSAANFVMDARTQGMAGAGTASASFLSAGFYNPALAALDHEGKYFGVLFPTIGVRYRDTGDLIGRLEDFSGLYGAFRNFSTNQNARTSALQAIKNLQGKQAIIAGNIAGSTGIATENISGVFFINAFTEGIALSEITQSDINNIANGSIATPTSKARVIGAGIIDLGLALAGKFKVQDLPTIAVGITPKIQKIYTYHQEVSITDFDVSDWTDISNRSDDSTSNLDFGIALEKGAFRIGAVGKNIFSKKVKTIQHTKSFTYELNPLFTLGTAWKTQTFTLSADIDLNKQERLLSSSASTINDNTQLIRLGGEYNFTSFVELRTGFIHDLENTFDDTLSLGLGIEINKLTRIDAALELIDKNSYGGSIQLSFGL